MGENHFEALPSAAYGFVLLMAAIFGGQWVSEHPTLAQVCRASERGGRIIVELTEQNSAPNIGDLREVLKLLRMNGIEVAIDDLGQGFSSLWLWSEVRPELVKVDMHFIQGVSRDPIKFQFLKSIQQIADSSGAKLIAEGIEERNDLLVVRDLGIAYGQGYLIARPVADPPRETLPSYRSLHAGPLLGCRLPPTGPNSRSSNDRGRHSR